jgi:hypothetical protein
MAYIFVNSFKQGLDARRSKISAQQGSLVSGKNVHINRGGEIEKRKAFVVKHALPAGTFGLHATRTNLYTFGSAAAPTMPAGVTYQQLVAATPSDMTAVISTDTFAGVPYVVASFASGAIHHFYNGVRVTDWDVMAGTVFTLGQALANLVTLAPAISASYSTVSGKATVTITADVTNVAFTVSSSVISHDGSTPTVAIVTTAAPAVGVAQVTTLTLTSASNTAQVSWAIIVNGVTYVLTTGSAVTGSSVRTFRNKMYATGQGLLYFSDTENAAEWTPAPTVPTSFAGFENLSSQTGQSDTLVAMAPYQNFLAVFARRATQIWSVVAGDPVSNVPVQILDNIGTVAPRSAINFGELDVFFLSDTGIRSLRARDASNSAVVYDVGTSIDPLVITRMKTLSEANLAKCCGVIEPREGRYMLAIGSEIFVYSFFPASNISAWTTYEAGFTVSEWAVQESKLYARSGNTIYLYGGDAGETYDTSEASVELSWLDADKAAHRKRFHGIDASCEGTWQIDYSTDPVSNQFVLAGHVIGQNFSLPSFGIAGYGTHVGFKFTSTDASAAKMSSFACHFEFTDPPK